MTVRRPARYRASDMSPSSSSPRARAARKPSAKKKKKKKPAKKGDSKPKVERKEYPLVGQKRDPPDETDSLRKFYTSLRMQKPESEMAEIWLMEHGLLPEEEQKKAYKKMLARKGKSAPAKRPASASKPKPPAVKKPKTEPGANKPKKAVAVDDDDSDDDAPLASLKRSGEGGGFTIPKTQAE